MRFWENSFSKVVPHDQFQKQYAYSFRHMYGKEGARKAYTPYSCMKIILGSPPEPGAFHGCPYKHATDAQLGTLLMGLKIDGSEAAEIGKIARAGSFQLACQRHFDVTHPGHLAMNLASVSCVSSCVTVIADVFPSEQGDGVANHPNQWFQSSVEYYKVKSGNSGERPVAADVDLSAEREAAEMDHGHMELGTTDAIE